MEIKPREIYSVPVSFYDKKTGEVSEKGKRPCVVSNVDRDDVYLFTLTSKPDQYPSSLYGVKVENNDTNGLHKESAILCTKDNSFQMSKEEFRYLHKLGEVSRKQLIDVMGKSTACNRKDIQLRFSVHKGMIR
ncbi:hypothetical protein GLW04_19365 [Halobacillus litoralis]|uniref:Type II toxin-antitoxin system PemK/MazF family toxin n=1 Tax=Halobacillus litoralis TaxID=45668 RepID=A0A845E7D0_9BACI|nr:hypothetical protein [Halobacillus litoralis]